MLKNLEADVLVGYNSLEEDTPKYFDISNAFYSDSLAWISPSPLEMTYWKRIYKMFSIKVWMVLATSALVWIFMVNLAHKNINLFELSFMVFQILLEHSVSKHQIKRKLSLRLMLLAWMTSFLVISTLFKNSLVIILGTEKRTAELFYLNDILYTSELKITSYINLSKLYVDLDNNKDYPLNFNEIQYCRSVLRCVNRTAFERNVVTTAPKSIVRYNWIPKYYINNEGKVLITVSREVIRPFFIHLIFSKGYPLFPQINAITMRMYETGWLDHLYNEMRIQIKRATTLLVFDAQKIGMSRFNFVFIMWSFGLCISALVFISEIYMHN